MNFDFAQATKEALRKEPEPQSVFVFRGENRVWPMHWIKEKCPACGSHPEMRITHDVIGKQEFELGCSQQCSSLHVPRCLQFNTGKQESSVKAIAIWRVRVLVGEK